MIRPRRLLPAVLLLLGLVGCGTGHQATPVPQPPVVPDEVYSGPDLNGIQLPDFQMPVIKGGVQMPKRSLTPGVAAATDASTVCTMNPHAKSPQLSAFLVARAYTEYGNAAPTNGIDVSRPLNWLVPYDLGGEPVLANIWPVSIHGYGYYQKVQTDKILRQLVCHRTISLATAQQALENNWYAAWLRYVVAGGHTQLSSLPVGARRSHALW
jgi:hypothetical protein